MKMTNEFQEIRDWASEKGIFEKGDTKTQYIKLQEEAGELAKAILKDDKEEFIDALGDCTIVLVNLAKLGGYNLEDCVNSAYEVISRRKGEMINGTFVKNIK
jgi:NTP pyrophosphatase (non-canonical NTP hydrolase)